MAQDIDLRDLNVPGFTRFSIKATDSIENQAIHNGFKEFSKIECNNDFTLGLKRLLEHYEHQNHIEALWSKMAELDARFEEILQKPEEKKEEDTGCFGNV